MEQVRKDFNGVPIRESVAQALDDRFLIQLKVKFNPETGDTEPDESDVVDLVELIQTYKDQCGVEAAIRLIKNGQATAEQFMDDGKHSADVTKTPATAQEIANALLQSEQFKNEFAEKFGIPQNAEKLTDEQLGNLISSKVEEVLGRYIKKQQEATNNG